MSDQEDKALYTTLALGLKIASYAVQQVMHLRHFVTPDIYRPLIQVESNLLVLLRSVESKREDLG
jgi:hypothetical protein